jgi:DNA-directed RNA polymerase specialized sigma24 family protein
MTARRSTERAEPKSDGDPPTTDEKGRTSAQDQKPSTACAGKEIANDFVTNFDRLYAADLFRVICHWLRGHVDEDTCRDVYQHVLYLLWIIVARKVVENQFDPENPLRLAVVVAGKTVCNLLRKLRREKRRMTALTEDMEVEDPWGRTPATIAEEREFEEAVVDGCRALLLRERQVLEVYLECRPSHSHAEMAEMLGMSLYTFQGVRRRGLAKLQRYLRDRYDEPEHGGESEQ